MSVRGGAIDTQAKSAPRPAPVEDIGETTRLAARRRERLLGLASPLGLLLAWEVAAQTGLIDVRFFPAPSTIIAALIELTRSGELVAHVLISLQRIGLGFLLGGIPAVIIGIAMGLWRPVRALIDPLIIATFPIPKSAILPFILLIFGFGEELKVVMVAIGVFFPIAINSTAGVLQINQVYLDVGKSFKASRWDTFRTIALAGRAALHHDRHQARRRHCAHSHCGDRDGRRQERHRLHDLERLGDFRGAQDVCRAVHHRADRLRRHLPAARGRAPGDPVEAGRVGTRWAVVFAPSPRLRAGRGHNNERRTQ